MTNEDLAKKLDKIIELLEKQIELSTDFYYITYPADGSTKTVSAGTIIIDLYEGIVKLPNGVEERLSDSLKAHDRQYARSFVIYCSVTAKYKLDDRGYKPIDGTQSERYQKFQRVTMETTEDTNFTFWACTNPDAFFQKFKDIITDEDGRTIVKIADPENAWGDVNIIGLIEHALRTKGIFTSDRRGEIFWYDDFEGSVLHWNTSLSGTNAAVDLSTESALFGNQSCKLTAGSDGVQQASMTRKLSKPPTSRVGVEACFTMASLTSIIFLDIIVDDATYYMQGQIALDVVNNRLSYLNTSGGYTVFATDVGALWGEIFAYYNMKLVIDPSTRKYLRCIFNDREYDMSTYDLFPSTSGAGRYMIINFYHRGQSGNPYIYLDNIVVTANEP